MIRILAALALLAIGIADAEAKTAQRGLFGTKLQFKKDNDGARFKSAATFYSGYQIQRL